MQDLGWLIALALLVLLFLVSAFFSSAETAIMSVNRLRLKRLVDQGDRRASRVDGLLRDTGALLSGILLGNNFANVMLASLATALAVPTFGKMAPVYVSPLLTVALLVFAEIVPKTYAAERSLRLSLRLSGPLQLFLRLVRPITRATSAIARILLKPWMRTEQADESVDVRDLAALAKLAHEEGSIETVTHEIVSGLHDFSQSTVRDVMIPRHEIISLSLSDGLDAARSLIQKKRLTRIPVWKTNKEQVVGVLHTKDLLMLAPEAKDTAYRALIRSPEFVPESISLPQLLHRMQESRAQILFVVDEYGGLEGLVTLKDVIAELVGDLADEFDVVPHQRVTEIREGSVIADASCSLRHLARKTGIAFGESSDRTVGGVLVAATGGELDPGQIVDVDGKRCTVLAMRGRYLKRIRIDVLQLQKEDG